MSRWMLQFENHAFRRNWEAFIALLVDVNIDDLSVTASVSELARLKKVASYIDALLQDLDPELVPLVTWDSFDQQTVQCISEINAYNSNKNIGHIQNANAYADNLLTYVRPYMVATGQIAKGMRKSISSYYSAFEENANAYRLRADEIIGQISAEKDDVQSVSASVKKIAEELLQVKEGLIGRENSPDGELHELDKKIANFIDKYKKISQLHEEIFEGDSENEPLSAMVKKSAFDAQIEARRIKGLSQQSTALVSDLAAFHENIFGIKGDEDELIGGLKAELDSGMERLAEFEQQQKNRYFALNEQIESLLPGATSAGLASSSGKMKSSFDKPITMANGIFYFAIAALVFLAGFFAIDKVSITNGIELTKFSDWQAVIGGLVLKAPFFAPFVWLAYYASSRRSEFQRLQQEYAHKEVVANSYESYRRQVEALGDSGSDLLKQLLEKAINTISYNASETLDKKHGDQMPVHSAIEKLVETADKLAGKIPNVNS